MNFMLLTRIKEIVEEKGFKSFKAKQIADGIYKQFVSEFAEITTLSKDERAQLEGESILSLEVFRVFRSQEDNTIKALLKLRSSGKLIETVLLNPKPGLWSTCISSQVGCAMACSFCATGTMGFLQNLTAEEIADQVLFWKQFIRKESIRDSESGELAKLSNVVFMGMGEPMANMNAVLDAIAELTNPEALDMGARNISVSTSGLVPGIKLLAENFPQVNLAISLHAPNDELRNKLMPVANKAFPLEKLAESIRWYLEKTNRKIFFEYILLKGENDSLELAAELVEWFKKINAPHLTHINLIVYNKTDSGHEESSRNQAREFKEYLTKNGFPATIRRNLGRDIMAACGQLVIKQNQ
jgi:23S rRNA (adenine(2503)-C(2))-methyltransferase